MFSGRCPTASRAKLLECLCTEAFIANSPNDTFLGCGHADVVDEWRILCMQCWLAHVSVGVDYLIAGFVVVLTDTVPTHTGDMLEMRVGSLVGLVSCAVIELSLGQVDACQGHQQD